MANASFLITLTTDFGTRDGYVAAMKGILLNINPAVRIVDVSHAVAPGDTAEAAYLLRQILPWFPAGTIHVVVVDPGVGGPRRAICTQNPQALCLGPDNGVLAPALESDSATLIYELRNPAYFRRPVSATFHGRDIFASVAGHLSLGCPPGDLGPRIRDPLMPSPAGPSVEPGRVAGRIVHVDHFGNLVTNIHRRHLEALAPGTERVVLFGNRTVSGIARTYSDAAEGQLLALVGSSGFLEIAVNRGRASDLLRQDHPDPRGLGVEVTCR